MNRRGRNYLMMAVVGAFIIGILATTAKPIDPARGFVADRTLIFAHQGGNLLRPGNTMAAFEHAVSLGVDGLEMDVHRTADDQLVVIHDARVDRTTNGRGAVREFSLAELQALDAGYHWPFTEKGTNNDTPFRAKGLRIPTLADVLKRFGDERLVIEIKPDDAEVSALLCAQLRQAGVLANTLVASFHQDAMVAFRKACPDGFSSAYRWESTRFIAHHFLHLMNLFHADAHALQLPPESYGVNLLSRAVLDSAHRRNMLLHGWTINDPQQMRQYYELGLDGLITDDPGTAMRIVRGE